MERGVRDAEGSVLGWNWVRSVFYPDRDVPTAYVRTLVQVFAFHVDRHMGKNKKSKSKTRRRKSRHAAKHGQHKNDPSEDQNSPM